MARSGMVAMLAWELKRALCGCRLGFQHNVRSVRVRHSVQPIRRLRARARAWRVLYWPQQDGRHAGLEIQVNPERLPI